jgi:hypothetical protein
MPLILPPSVARVRDEARGKVLQCTTCEDGVFGIDQFEKFARHVRQCSERHDDEIQAALAKRQKTYFNQPADVERYGHFRRGGKS